MTLLLAISLDRHDWTWRPRVERTPWALAVGWLCVYVRVAR